MHRVNHVDTTVSNHSHMALQVPIQICSDDARQGDMATTPFIYSVSDLPVPSSRTGLYLCSSRGLGRQPNRRSRPGVWVSERSIVTNSLSPREWRCGETVLLAGIKPRSPPSCCHQIWK